MNKTRFLILSDIHFGELANCSTFAVSANQVKNPIINAKPMKDCLIDALRTQTSGINAILVPGDLTSQGDPAEFCSCVQTVTEIANHLHVPPDRVYYTFGNHDVNWPICDLKSAGKSGDYYQKVAAHVGSLFVPNGNPHIQGPVPGSAVYKGDSYTIIVLNSGYFSIKDQAYYHGKLGQDQLNWLRSTCDCVLSEETWNLLLLHHHPQNYPFPTVIADISTLEEGAELMEIAGSARFLDMIIHGHRHHPRIVTNYTAGWHSPITFLSAGSVAVNPQHRRNGEIDNLFHIVTLESRLDTSAAFGCIDTFHYKSASGWTRVRYLDEMPIDGIQHFGSVVSKADKIAQFVDILHNLVDGAGNNPVSLPKHEDLTSDLRCTQLHKLHEILMEAAHKVNCQIMGKYPDDVIALASPPIPSER